MPESLLRIPIAHGEGRFYADDSVLARLRESGQIVFRYADNDGMPAEGGPANPNGSLDDIAGICDPTGRFLGIMPHPERAVQALNDPRYFRVKEEQKRCGDKIPEMTAWLQLFRNAVEYFNK